MQPGSGSFGAKLGLTYLWQNDLFSAGGQTNALIRINDNDRDYKLGNVYDLTGWLAIKTTDYLSFSVRGEANYVDETEGMKTQFNPMMSTTTDPKNSGGFKANMGLGANFLVPGKTLKGLRFGVEVNLPLYQDLNGVQLQNDYALTFGTQYSF